MGRNQHSKDRMFITAEPMDTDEMRVRLIERGGKGRVGIAICALAENGDEDELADFEWNENRSERRDDSQSLSRRFHGVRGRWIVVKLDGKSVAKRFRYKLRLDA